MAKRLPDAVRTLFPIKTIIKSAYVAVPFKQQLFGALRHLNVPTPLMRHLRFDGTIEVRIDAEHGFLINNSSTYVENHLFWRGYGRGWEGTSLQIWRALAPQANVILDIGASTGVYCLAARCLNRDGCL